MSFKLCARALRFLRIVSGAAKEAYEGWLCPVLKEIAPVPMFLIYWGFMLYFI